MEQFRARLVGLHSLNDIKQLARELGELELGERLPLTVFVVRSILREIHNQLSDRPLESATWHQVQEELSEPMGRVIDAYQAGNPEGLLERLNDLARRWVQTRQELTE